MKISRRIFRIPAGNSQFPAGIFHKGCIVPLQKAKKNNEGGANNLASKEQ